jgi:arylformamidase
MLITTRRTLLGGALAATATSAARRLLAQPQQTHLPPGMAPHIKGPLVFLDYDQQELDATYDQTPWAPNRPEITKRTKQKNAAARARLGPPRRLAYGPSEIEKLDLYATDAANAPMHLFVHGGGWRVGSAAGYAYRAEMLVAAGAHFIALDFSNVLDAGGDLMTLAAQVRRAIAWVYRNAASFGGDPERLYVSGHSSGGHLAAVALTTDWQHDHGLPRTTIKGGLCASGIYDLYPVSLSARSSYVRLTPEVVAALSPMRHLDQVAAPIIIGYGTADTPEFQRQSRDFAAALERAGKPVTLIVAAGYNHFEIVEDLGNPYGVLGRAVLEQMNLGA